MRSRNLDLSLSASKVTTFGAVRWSSGKVLRFRTDRDRSYLQKRAIDRSWSASGGDFHRESRLRDDSWPPECGCEKEVLSSRIGRIRVFFSHIARKHVSEPLLNIYARGDQKVYLPWFSLCVFESVSFVLFDKHHPADGHKKGENENQWLPDILLTQYFISLMALKVVFEEALFLLPSSPILGF